jgi:hypothetical protein
VRSYRAAAAGVTPATKLDGADYKLGAAAAQAQLTAARVDRDQQRLDVKRFEELNRQGFISGADLERRMAEYTQAVPRQPRSEAAGLGMVDWFNTLTPGMKARVALTGAGSLGVGGYGLYRLGKARQEAAQRARRRAPVVVEEEAETEA